MFSLFQWEFATFIYSFCVLRLFEGICIDSITLHGERMVSVTIASLIQLSEVLSFTRRCETSPFYVAEPFTRTKWRTHMQIFSMLENGAFSLLRVSLLSLG